MTKQFTQAETITNLATKQDVEIAKTDLTKEIGSLRTDIHKEVGLVRADMNKETGSIREDLAAMEARLIKWTIGTGVGVGGLVVALIKLF